MNRKHDMPFGAEYLNNSSVRFRLWAPDASQVRLRLLNPAQRELAMNAVGEGWFELTTREACAGTRYQFSTDHRQVVPDPASRFQPEGVHGASAVIDPYAYEWRDAHWRGRPWEEAVIYELHVGTFTPDGTYAGGEKRLDYLAELGVTAIELMPVSSFPGERNWGYDGVQPFAPANAYGRPEDLKHFVDAAHAKSLMVFLDVVYNHFGPEGNYLPLYAPQFFTDRHKTPWGQAINFDGASSRVVRDYFIHNTLYWIEEFHFDGLRFDAVHAIKDDSRPDILEEIAETIHRKVGRVRHVHLVLENDDNGARYLLRDEERIPRCYTAQWNDDIHHAAHVIVTGENEGYYADYSRGPEYHLARCLAEGFSFQGEASAYRDGMTRGESSWSLPPEAFVSFLQNHDQVGNRAFGERIVQVADPENLRAALAVLLLAPSPPLMFMGEEFGATTPFLFFCDFGSDVAAKVTHGRRNEFARFVHFRSPEARARIPDPSCERTFLASKLDWASLDQPVHHKWLEFYGELLAIRQREIVPRIRQIAAGKGEYQILSEKCFLVRWPFIGGGRLEVLANFAGTEIRIPEGLANARVLHVEPRNTVAGDALAPRSATWVLNE